jgi:hypothetical protein
MSRDEAYLNAMLRQLGAPYYQTMHGEGTASDVARAVDAVAEAQGRRDLATQPGRSGASGDAGSHLRGWHRRSWRVRDVMTTDVATADTDMTYKRVARLMTDRRVNAVPVVDNSRKVLGMVSEADVPAPTQPRAERGARAGASRVRAGDLRCGADRAAVRPDDVVLRHPAPFETSSSVPLTLTFRQGGTVTIEATVTAPGTP